LQLATSGNGKERRERKTEEERRGEERRGGALKSPMICASPMQLLARI
jgi:hypothetical protein